MTRARVEALHDKVKSILSTLNLDTTLDGMLPHADVLCVIRYKVTKDPGEEDTPWSREGEEQLDMKTDVKMDVKLDMELDMKISHGRAREEREACARGEDDVQAGPAPG